MEDFIGTFDNALSKEYCEKIIDKFEKSKDKSQGSTGQGVNIHAKNSLDITIDNFSDWNKERQYISEVTWNHLALYFKKYPYLLVGALSFFIPDPRQPGAHIQITYDMINMISDAHVKGISMSMYRLGAINTQKYFKGQGHYNHFHSETYPKPNDPECDSLHRVLLFMYYLNDIEEGGETEFFYQQKKLKPKQGQLVIAPSGFTHTHKGHMPISNDKYILTSWVLFKKAKDIYGS